MTGITRVSKESIFSDLNHLKVVTSTSTEYADCFGFTDGFIFGEKRGIYNPRSILNYLDTGGKFKTYWANTSSNSLVSKLIRESVLDDLDAMNEYMNKAALQTFSYFDVGAVSGECTEPERFYHCFVLGLMVDLKRRYVIASNRESSLEETLENALKQIEEKQYEAELLTRGIPAERIRKYGFAFEGKQVLIG